MTYTVRVGGGEYRCAIRTEKIRPLGRHNFAARVERVFYGTPSGEQREISARPFHEHWGETAEDAERLAEQEFDEWAQRQLPNG